MRCLLLFSVVLILSLGCVTNTFAQQADEAVVKEITSICDNFYSEMKSINVDAFKKIMTDNSLYCGTDPGEFWTKDEMLKLLSQMAENKSLKLELSVDKRVIRVGADGKSAVVVEQSAANWISKNIPVRLVSYWIKTGDGWKLDFQSASMVPKNEDLVKIDKMLK